jgi:hypothetical protein
MFMRVWRRLSGELKKTVFNVCTLHVAKRGVTLVKCHLLTHGNRLPAWCVEPVTFGENREIDKT